MSQTTPLTKLEQLGWVGVRSLHRWELCNTGEFTTYVLVAKLQKKSLLFYVERNYILLQSTCFSEIVSRTDERKMR